MQNPFARFFATLQPTQESVVGVDVGSAYLKVVQLRRKGGKAILETYGSLALGPYASVEVGRATRLGAEKLIEALKDLMREAHITATRADFATPFSSSLVMQIEMPLLPEKELAQAVPIEARKFIPVPMGEVALEWWLLPQEPGAAPAGKTRVLVAAIHKEAATRFAEVAAGAALTVGAPEIEAFSALRALLADDLAPRAVIDLGAGETKLYLTDRGVLQLSHSVNHGAQDLTLALSRSLNLSIDDAEILKREKGLAQETAASFQGVLNATFAEVASALRAFEKKAGHPVTEVVLTGGGANLLGLSEFVERALSLRISRANPFSRVEAPAFLDETLRAVGPEFSVAIGVAFKALQEIGG